MPGTNYLPTRDAALITWATNFDQKVRAAYTDLGLSTDQATELTAALLLFSANHQTANNPDTRSPTAIIAKDGARHALVQLIRSLARIIHAHPAVTDVERSELGLSLRDRSQSPIPAPTIAPGLDIISAVGRTIHLRLHESSASLRRGKPRGVAAAGFYSSIGAAPPAELDDWHFHGHASRTRVSLAFAAEIPPGALIWLTARWLNPRMQPGPLAHPVSIHLGGGVSTGVGAGARGSTLGSGSGVAGSLLSSSLIRKAA